MKNKLKFLITGNLDKNFYNMKELVPVYNKIQKFDIKHIGFLGFEQYEDFQEKINETGNIFNYFDNKDLIDINNMLFENIMKYEFDVLILKGIMFYHTFLLPQTIERIKKEGKFVVCEFGDNELNFYLNKFWLSCFNLCVSFTKKECLDYNKLFNNAIIRYSGANIGSKEVSVLPEEEKKYDVLFIGAPYGSRPKYIKYLINRGINVSVFGKKQWTDYKTIKPYYKGYISNEKYDEEVKKAKILLGLMEWTDGKPHLNAKLFDAAKTKTFIISTNYKPFVEDYGFEEGNDIVTYKNIEDLYHKIQYYLDKPDLRKKIIENLYLKVKNVCDLKDRFEKEFDVIEQNTNEQNFEKLAQNINLTIIYPLIKNKEIKKLENINQILVTKNKNEVSESQNIFHYKMFIKNFDNLVKTDYVILGNENIEYCSFLGKYIHFINKNFNIDLAVFNVISPEINYRNYRKRFIYDINSVIWSKEYFKDKLLSRIFSKKYVYDLKLSALKIPIYFCNNNYSRKYIKLEKFYVILRNIENYWRKIKK